MSMITGCPACGTLFKVVPDQLKISEGWVRCGHCSEVFDATSHLQQAAPPAVPAPAPRAAEEPAPQAADDGLVTSELPSGLADDDVPATQPPAGVEPWSPADVWAPSTGAFLNRRDAEPGETPPDFARSQIEPAAPKHDAGSTARDEDDEDDDTLEQVTFVREARRKAFWRRPAVRAGLVAVGLASLAVLALQVAVHERDRVAALYPQWRPLLEQVCQPLGCTIGAPRRIDAIVIDSSGFAKLRADAYRLSFTLKNQAAMPVAVPSLELTLTDTQDQPVLRRVLTPRELGAPVETLASTSDWSAALAVAVDPAAAGGRIAGYRLLAFYP